MPQPCAVAAWFENGVWPDVACPAQCAGPLADADAGSCARVQVASHSSAARGAAETSSASMTTAHVRPQEEGVDRAVDLPRR